MEFLSKQCETGPHTSSGTGLGSPSLIVSPIHHCLTAIVSLLPDSFVTSELLCAASSADWPSSLLSRDASCWVLILSRQRRRWTAALHSLVCGKPVVYSHAAVLMLSPPQQEGGGGWREEQAAAGQWGWIVLLPSLLLHDRVRPSRPASLQLPGRWPGISGAQTCVRVVGAAPPSPR